MPELPRPHIRTANDPGVNLFIEPTTDFNPEPSLAQHQELLYNSVNQALKDDHLNYPSYQGIKQQYDGSEYQAKKYKELSEKDPLYAMYISRNYGSYQNYLSAYNWNVGITKVFDPTVDQKMDVTIITKEVFYKSDHISSQELIRLYMVVSIL